MRRSIFLKLFGSTFLVVLIMAALFLLTAFRGIRSTTQESLAADLEKICRALEGEVLRLRNGPAEGDLAGFLKDFGRKNQLRLTFIEPDGSVTADSEEDPRRMENHRFRPEVRQALEGKTGRAVHFSRTLKLDMLYVGWPLVQEGRIVGCLRVSTYVRDIQVMLAGFRRTIAWTTLIVTILALLITFLVAGSFTRTIRRMTAFSREIAEGKLGAKVYIRSRDELGRLAASLNAMSEKTRDLFAEVSARREDLQGVLSSMKEGLVVIDRTEKIVLANPAFQQIASPGPATGRHYWEAVRSPEFQEFVKALRQEQASRSDSIAINGRMYLCHGVLIGADRRLLVTFHEIAEA